MDRGAWQATVHGVTKSWTPGDLSNPGIEPRSPTLQADSLLSEPPGKPKICRGSASWLSSHGRGLGPRPWDFFGRNDAEAETPVLGPPHVKS